MIKVCYAEMDGPSGLTCRLDAAGHAGYAPAGQDIVCAGASLLMQTLVYVLADEDRVHSDGWDETEGPRLSVVADAPQRPRVEAAFDFVKAGFTLLAERYPDHVRFADVSARGEQAMMDLQLFAGEGEGGDAAAPALSRAQAQQAAASGTLRSGQKAAAKAEGSALRQAASAAPKADTAPTLSPEQRRQAIASGTLRPSREPTPEKAAPTETKPEPRPTQPLRVPESVRSLHSRWALEEALLRRTQPNFSLREELKNPEMRRLMQMPGMRMRDAYRLAHYGDTLRQTAHAVEQGVVERIRQRGARPAENGIRTGSAAVTKADVAHSTLAQREALERQVLHGAKIKL